MIDPIQVKVNADIPLLFKNFDYITFDKDADIDISEFEQGWIVWANKKMEVWVRTLEEKIMIKRGGQDKPIIILTEDEKLLPYCMKDRLAYLQDRVNKEKNEKR